LLSLSLGVLGSACGSDAASAERIRDSGITDSGALPETPALPSWAVEAGHDAYGAWADFAIAGHRTRLRSIPMGTFTMGSADAETGRGPDELRHEVTLTHDYWLAESECSQTLWQLVMDGNPSQFVSDARPVERITWPDVQLFLARLNERVPGLGARLPSEAEWEHGCRAGTTSDTYAGELAAVSPYNAPVLDGIAWYGGNSGVEFELDNGFDTSAWPDKQHPQELAGSHPVMRKQPNGWGLYDCLGNLWEWCQDWYGPYAAEPAVDPTGPASSDGRVIRGGSWSDRAAEIRVAKRNRGTPVDKVIILGFRIARGPDK
jgi:formylglycine-generating enzyme required for sulfatase activity